MVPKGREERLQISGRMPLSAFSGAPAYARFTAAKYGKLLEMKGH
jgi:hypothetical protein